METGRPVSDFRAAAFSFSFEADYLNIPKILGPNIDLLRRKRAESDTILLAGGPAVTLNPAALADIFDAIVIGEVEEIAGSILKIIKEHRKKEDVLRKLSLIRGIFVPDFNSVDKVKQIYTKKLDDYPTHSTIWTRDTEFGHMHLVEVGRGCPWNCSFCATPPLYEPHRFRSTKTILKSIEYGLEHRKHVGLIGSDVAGHPNFTKIAKDLVKQGIKVSVSSIRVDRITKGVASILKESGHRRVTLGIEAGTEHLRKLINKNISDSKIFSAVKNLAQAGITNLKLYYMIGLPDETEDDVLGIVRLTAEIRKLILEERKSKTLAPNISLVITPFVPKKLTPFSDQPFAGIPYLNNTLKTLRSMAGKIPNVKVTGESARQAHTEYLLSQGNSEISDLLIKASKTDNPLKLIKL